MTEIVIHNAQDIINALDQNPEFLNQVRNYILTKRLLELPDQVDTLVISVNRLAETVALLADRVQRLEDRQQVFEDRQQVFEDRQQRFEDRQHGFDSERQGDRYHNKSLRNITYRSDRDLGMTNSYVIAADGSSALPEWHRILQQANNRRDLDRDEIEDLTDTDVVVADANGRHAAVEVSIHADTHDVTRARRRADLITKATTQQTVAAVICAGLSPQAEAAAQAQNVVILRMRQ